MVPVALAAGAEYEPVRLKYTEPRPRFYKPDAVFENGIVVEFKGRFTPADRAKLLNVKGEYPELELRLVFQTPNQRLNPKSATTNASWAVKHGFPFASAKVDLALWAAEPTFPYSLATLAQYGERIVKAPRPAVD